jgi:peptide/nickel transport system substrate-binding protein
MSELDRLTDLARAGRLTRRQLLDRAAALGLGAAAATSLLGVPAGAQTPNKGGHLKLGLTLGSSTDSLDPSTYTSTVMQVIGHTFGNALTEVDKNGELIPSLAESWDASADPGAAQWVFKLRPGVTFHNGKEMDAEDVVYSINLHRGPDSQSGAAGQMKQIKDIRATGKHEVTIELVAGNADLPFVVSDYHLLIMPKDGDPAAGVGTGPYVKESFEPGVSWLARRNPDYFKSDRGHVDSVEVTVINDTTARTAALRTGQVHLANRMDPKTLSLLERDPGIQILNTTGKGHYTIPMHTDRPPFDDNNVRLALKHAINRQEILDKILRGYGKLGNDHPIAEIDQFHAADLEQRQYDPDKARFYMEKSGFEGPITVHTAEAAFAGATDAAVLFKEHAAAAGIDLVIQREPDDGYWDNVWLKEPFVFCYWGGRATPDMMFSVAYAADAAWNDAHWNNPRFNELLVAARAELDVDKRKAMYAEMQQIVRDDGGTIVPVFNDWLDAGRTNVKGWNYNGTWEMCGFRAPEICWLEDA